MGGGAFASVVIIAQRLSYRTVKYAQLRNVIQSYHLGQLYRTFLEHLSYEMD